MPPVTFSDPLGPLRPTNIHDHACAIRASAMEAVARLAAGKVVTPDVLQRSVERTAHYIETGRWDVPAPQEMCSCESYEPCFGACCGVGNCTCTPKLTEVHAALSHHFTPKDDPCQDRGVDWPCDVARAFGNLTEETS